MASATLYPPIINTTEPAFNAESEELKIHFSLSALSSIDESIDKLTAHVFIMRKDGVKVLNTQDEVSDSESRYRATGIILNLKLNREENLDSNYYYVTIKKSDLKTKESQGTTQYNGFIPGAVYKVQIRLSKVKYTGTGGQAAQIQANSSQFSEQSNYCYVKAISNMVVTIPMFEYKSDDLAYIFDEVKKINQLEIKGSIYSSLSSSNEFYKYCTVDLYKDNTIIERSGEIYPTEISNSAFNYVFKSNLVLDQEYQLWFNYVTENEYTLNEPIKFTFQLDDNTIGGYVAEIRTVDIDPNNIFSDISTVYEEEEEGRIGLKLKALNGYEGSYYGSICIRRASQEDNFSTQQDIKIITFKGSMINDYPVIQDYTIQSGIQYIYGVQTISALGERGKLNIKSTPIQRIFNYSFLLGKNDQQLKLKFDNVINSFKTQMLESKTETIGSKYPYITRNAVVGYRTFPITGLVSLQMDENNVFLKNGKNDIYNPRKNDYNINVINQYNNYNLEHNISQYYDYTYERDFRKQVTDFLQDGDYKLFKSPTEGNIIVRLMDVNFTPNQTLDRMIYSFSATANEVDENNIENYLKYGFLNPGFYSTDAEAGETITFLGQLEGPFPVYGLTNGSESLESNILKLIYEKYDSQGKNYGGLTRTLLSVSRLKITITDPPLKIKNNGSNNSKDYQLGQNFRYNNNQITIYNLTGVYEFDSLIEFKYKDGKTLDNLYFLDSNGSGSDKKNYINATIDFLYTMKIGPYVSRIIETRRKEKGIGQFQQNVTPGTNIQSLIYCKYYIESSKYFKRLDTITSIEIEANPHTVFAIKDTSDNELQYHEVNETGVLNFYEISDIANIIYVGRKLYDKEYDKHTVSDNIITQDVEREDFNGRKYKVSASADVSITYYFSTVTGTYKQKAVSQNINS